MCEIENFLEDQEIAWTKILNIGEALEKLGLSEEAATVWEVKEVLRRVFDKAFQKLEIKGYVASSTGYRPLFQ